jgi:hypothetical protein
MKLTRCYRKDDIIAYSEKDTLNGRCCIGRE